MLSSITILILLIVSIAFFIGAVRHGRARDGLQGYFLDSGRLGRTQFVGSLVAANLSLGNMVFVCGVWGYAYGLQGVAWLALSMLMLTAGFVLIARRLKAYVENRENDGTLHEFIASPFQEHADAAALVRMTSSIVTVITLVLVTALEVHLAAGILATLSNGAIQTATAFIGLMVAVALYCAYGGFRSVVYTDLWQATLCVLSVLGLIVALVASGLGWDELANLQRSAAFVSPSIADVTGLMFLCFAWLFVTMDQWQRACASRSLEITRSGTIAGGMILVAVVAAYGLLGALVRTFLEPHLPGAIAF
ncbi:MAG: hypothetical protein HY275_05750 [Gemmatimonadetes bacterium]|nr:hypothetical protein [Gemmatimonadota bacterium]